MVPLRLIGLHQFISVKDQTRWAFRSYKHSFSSPVRQNFRLIILLPYLFHTSFPPLLQHYGTIGLFLMVLQKLGCILSLLLPYKTPFSPSLSHRKKKNYQILLEIATSQLIFSLCTSICRSVCICNTDGADLACFQYRLWSVSMTQLCKQ